MKVAIIFGSKSDTNVMKGAANALNEYGISYKAYVLSAHRVPEKLSETIKEVELLNKIREALIQNKPIRSLDFTSEELAMIKAFNFLTLKPIIYMANVEESDLLTDTNDYVEKVRNYAKEENSKVITVCAKIESELSELSDEDKKTFLEDLGIKESGLDKLIKATYDLLGLATYFTVGSDEVKAWTFTKGMKAPECAGIIHSDFERGFIRAEVMSYEALEDLKEKITLCKMEIFVISDLMCKFIFTFFL